MAITNRFYYLTFILFMLIGKSDQLNAQENVQKNDVDSEKVERLFNQAEVKIQKGDYIGAEIDFRQIVAIDSTNFKYYYKMGSAYFNVAANKIKNMSPKSVDLVTLSDEMDQFNLLMMFAQPYLEKANSLLPDNFQVNKALCAIYRSKFQDSDTAIDCKALGL